MIWKKAESEEAPSKEHALPAPAPAPVSRQQSQPPQDRALIGPSIEIQGTLNGAEDLQIEGRVDGKIELPQHTITIGKNGRVKADIVGRTIVVMGEVNGNLFGEEQIILHQSSRVWGNLFAPRVTLEDGAQFKGSIDMSSKADSISEAAPAKAYEAVSTEFAAQK
jgi:cytoskeletal protein CcmA (bactofilin family)